MDWFVIIVTLLLLISFALIVDDYCYTKYRVEYRDALQDRKKIHERA